MTKLGKWLSVATVIAGLMSGVAATSHADAGAPTAPKKTMKAFKSEAEFKSYLLRTRKPGPVHRTKGGGPMAVPSPAPPPAAMDGAVASDAAPASAEESITNTQEAGVDEGGIVKNHGDKLVILRRGRLFTVATKNGGLKPIDSIEAYPPGVSPSGDWYDEMLVAGDRVIVIGYSYARGGTEINRFRIDREGYLSFEDGYHLKSNDYYSSRNYASRLIGNRLIVYSPLYLPYQFEGSMEFLPGVRRWRKNADRSKFKRIVAARDIYIPPVWEHGKDVRIDALHTVTDCDLTAEELDCKAHSVLGPNGRNFYVSPHAVYVWVSQPSWGRTREEQASSMVYRLPLDGSAPSAIGVRGQPTDQFSFREDWADGRLNVLVRSGGGGDAMWRPEFSSGDVALLQVPLRAFGDGSEEVRVSNYRDLPLPKGSGYALQNRFVGDYVLYGLGNSWGHPEKNDATLIAARVSTDRDHEIELEHGVDRIEAMGNDAVVVGSDKRDLRFQAIELTAGSRPEKGDRYRLGGAAQGETRSHAFFFKPEPDRARDDLTSGMLGLPVARAARPAYRQLVESSSSILFLRRSERKFSELGELGAEEARVVDDKCQASCADWYGNSRPIFMGGRVFALMGYEIVEGEVGSRSIREVRRINFAPSVR